MRKKTLRSREKGLALVAVLLLLLVLTVAGSTLFLMTGSDLKISINAQQNLSALYAAEAGMHSLLAFFRRAPEAFFLKKNGSALNVPTSEPAGTPGDDFRVWLTALRYDPAAIPRYVECIVQSRDPESGASARIGAVIVHNPLPEPFGIGLVTAGRLQAEGAVDVQTGIHANQGYSLDPALADQLRQNQYPLTQAVDPAAADYRPALTGPTLSAADLDHYRNLAQTGNNLFLQGNQELDLAGDQQGLLIFVAGNARVQASDLSGVTLVATGRITLFGNIRFNARQQIDTALLAGGDILLNNAGEACGVFWSGGALIPAGAGKVEGIIVSQGGVRADRSFRFQRSDRLQNPYLPPPSSGPPFVLKGWLQL